MPKNMSKPAAFLVPDDIQDTLLKSRMVYHSGASLPRLSWQGGHTASVALCGRSKPTVSCTEIYCIVVTFGSELHKGNSKLSLPVC